MPPNRPGPSCLPISLSIAESGLDADERMDLGPYALTTVPQTFGHAKSEVETASAVG